MAYRWNVRSEQRQNEGGRRPIRWPGYVQFLFISVLSLLFVWLALSMVEHRFGHGSISHQMYVNRP